MVLLAIFFKTRRLTISNESKDHKKKKKKCKNVIHALYLNHNYTNKFISHSFRTATRETKFYCKQLNFPKR